LAVQLQRPEQFIEADERIAMAESEKTKDVTVQSEFAETKDAV